MMTYLMIMGFMAASCLVTRVLKDMYRFVAEEEWEETAFGIEIDIFGYMISVFGAITALIRDWSGYVLAVGIPGAAFAGMYFWLKRERLRSIVTSFRLSDIASAAETALKDGCDYTARRISTESGEAWLVTGQKISDRRLYVFEKDTRVPGRTCIFRTFEDERRFIGYLNPTPMESIYTLTVFTGDLSVEYYVLTDRLRLLIFVYMDEELAFRREMMEGEDGMPDEGKYRIWVELEGEGTYAP